MTGKKIRAALIALGLVAGSLAAAAPAYADNYGTMPSGCSLSPSTPHVSASRVYWGGSGSCSLAYQMDSRLVHNYDGLPDVRVAVASSYSSPNFSASGSTCDGGGTTQYYTENAFYYRTRDDTARVSGTVTLSHC